MDKPQEKIVTIDDLNRVIREEISALIASERENIVKRAHARLRAERSVEVKANEQET